MGKYKICVYAICKNEKKFAARWYDSMKEADGVYVLDTGSTDGTPDAFRQLGAVVEEKDISPWRFDTARNRSMAMLPDDCDICVCTDIDEVFHAGWREKLEAAWRNGVKRARYRYTWNFNPDGSEGIVFFSDKIHARRGFRWVNPVHEILQYDDGDYQTVTVPGMQLDHHADDSKSRAQYLPLLELSVAENPNDDRGMHYLGREYMFRGRYDEAIQTLQRHLAMPAAVWRDERCASMRYIGKCLEKSGKSQEAENWYFRAVAEAPYLREPWIDAALFAYRRQDWELMTAFCKRALAITEIPDTYITEAASRGSLPYDLLSLGLYHTGRYREAAAAAETAAQLSPADVRIQRNLQLIKQALKQE